MFLDGVWKPGNGAAACTGDANSTRASASAPIGRAYATSGGGGPRASMRYPAGYVRWRSWVRSFGFRRSGSIRTARALARIPPSTARTSARGGCGEPSEEHFARSERDAPVRLGEPEVRALVLEVVALEVLEAIGNVLDAHPPADFAPEVEAREALLLDQTAPTEPLVPADGLEDKRREHVQEVLVRDLEAAVQAVHAADRARSLGGVVAGLDDRAQDQVGVVVPALGALRELARGVEQLRDRRRAERPEERELERASRVEGEFVHGVDVGDPLRVAFGIQFEDLAQVPRGASRAHTPILRRALDVPSEMDRFRRNHASDRTPARGSAAAAGEAEARAGASSGVRGPDGRDRSRECLGGRPSAERLRVRRTARWL